MIKPGHEISRINLNRKASLNTRRGRIEITYYDLETKQQIGRTAVSVMINSFGRVNYPSKEKAGWIKAELPTSIVYWSTKSSNHNMITSIDHRVVNQSSRPIRVEVIGFNERGLLIPNITGIKTLVVTELGHPIPLVHNGRALVYDRKEHAATMFDLGPRDSRIETRKFKLPQEGTFKISGTTKFSFLPKATHVNNGLIFEISPLDEDR